MALDEAAGTANGNAASFGDEVVTWHDPANGSDYSLNRVSGIMNISGCPTYTCHPGQKQF